MSKVQSPIAGDVCTLEPLAQGVVAHRYGQVPTTEPAGAWGKPKREFIAWPKCEMPPAEDEPAPKHWREASYDWAMARGAERCTKCFP
jgi:hypothetical protein